MKFLFFLIFFQVFIIPCYSQTQEKAETINKELTTCLDKTENQTTAGMCDCIYEALRKWDEKLNAIYKSLLSTLDTGAKGKLIEAQRQWIKFKEKEIEFIDATYGNTAGTMWRVVRAQKVLDITRTRAIGLEDLVNAKKEY